MAGIAGMMIAMMRGMVGTAHPTYCIPILTLARQRNGGHFEVAPVECLQLVAYDSR